MMRVCPGKTNELFPQDRARGTILVTIRRLDQEGRTYFYLEHPVKINGRVRKYSKYLGKAIPENVDDLKKQFLFEINSSRWAAVSERAKEKVESLKNGLSSVQLENMQHNSALSFTANSLMISGSKITMLELKRLIEESKVPRWRTPREIKEAKAHYEIARDNYKCTQEFSFGLIVDWHWKLFRESQPSIAGMTKDSIPVAREIDSYYDENSEKVENTMLAALIHRKLIRDKPFIEENDIIARLSMNYLLQMHGYPILDVEFNERKRYESALKKSILQNDESIFLKWFFLKYERKIC